MSRSLLVLLALLSGCAVVVPAQQVRVVEVTPVYEVYYHAGAYWRVEGESWYRAETREGPFVMIESVTVPVVVPTVVIQRHDHGKHKGHGKHGKGNW